MGVHAAKRTDVVRGSDDETRARRRRGEEEGDSGYVFGRRRRGGEGDRNEEYVWIAKSV